MELAYLIAHPQELNQETLYDLRRLVAVYPTFHAARILFLQNLFLLHDPLFDQELRRAALLVPDRRVLFDLTHNLSKLTQANVKASKKQQPAVEPQEETPTKVAAQPAKFVEIPAKPVEQPAEEPAEAVETEVPQQPTAPQQQEPENGEKQQAGQQKMPRKKYAPTDTTARLLDNFLETTPAPLAKKTIKADPSTDYMAYLLQQDEEEAANAQDANAAQASASDLRLDALIDSFIASSNEGITLSEDPMIPEEFREETKQDVEEADEVIKDVEETPEETEDALEDIEEAEEDIEEIEEEEDLEEETLDEEEMTELPNGRDSAPLQPSSELTEQLAQIYIKQGKYERAIEILSKISTSESATRNPYLADQMRFLKKLASLNAKNNKSK